MSIVERARVALRNWINKPSVLELQAAERVRADWVQQRLAEIGRCWDDALAHVQGDGPDAVRAWLTQQHAWLASLDGEASADELQMLAKELLKAKAAEAGNLGRFAVTG